MNAFESSRVSEALVVGSPEQVWSLLTDPDVIARLTPFVHSIREQGEVWVWRLAGIPYPGGHFSPQMRQHMSFTPLTRIDFRPESESSEAGATGRYDIAPAGDGTSLRIALTVFVTLPLPRLVRPAVEAAMSATLTKMGDAFSRGFERELAHPRRTQP